MMNSTTSNLLDIKLNFKLFPAFAKWILDNKLDEYCQLNINFSRELNVPLLKFFDTLSEDEFFNIVKIGSIELLESFVNNSIPEYLSKATLNYKNNLLPLLEKESVLAEDITLISLIRRRVFRNLLHSYTKDIVHFGAIMEELDLFITAQELNSFNTFIVIQSERLEKANNELALKNKDLLEAEDLACMGSFNWNIGTKKSEITPGIKKILKVKEPGDIVNFLKQVHEDDADLVEIALKNAFEGDGKFQCNYRFIIDQSEKWISARGQVKFDNRGKPLTMKGTLMDITDEMVLLQRLQESEKLNKHVQSITKVGNWTWDLKTGKVNWSDEMYRIYGLEPQSEQITLERFFSFIHPDDQAQRKAEIEEALKTGIAKDYILRIKAADGSSKVLRGMGEVLTDKNKNPIAILGSCQNITKEHILQKKNKEREIYLSHLIENAPDAIVVYDDKFKITLFNPKSEEIFGYKNQEVIGKSFLETIFPTRYQSDYFEKLNNPAKASREFYTGLELIAQNKSQKEFHISITVSSSSKFEKALYIAFLRDISKAKQLQLDLESLNLSLAQKNSELEHINQELNSYNYVVSHDLKEPLRKVQMFTDRIMEISGEELSVSSKEYLNKTIAATQRMKQLIEDLLTFSQTTVSENSNFTEVNLGHLLDEVQAELSVVIEDKQVKINVDSLPIVFGINFQLHQLFSNLLANAIKYGPVRENIHPIIHVTCEIKSNIPFSEAPKNQKFYEIAVSDNGIGFDSIYSEKIFELFQRLHTRDKYKGTGVGLAICKKIMHNHNGYIRAESTLGLGSTFYIYLPAISSI